MRDLDTRAQSLMRTIDSLADQYLHNVSTMSLEKRKEQMECIQSQFNKAKEYGDDKVQLAIQTYELVDKHIRRLDSDLARFETEIQDKALSKSLPDDVGSQKSKYMITELKTIEFLFFIFYHVTFQKVARKIKILKKVVRRELKEFRVKKILRFERNRRRVEERIVEKEMLVLHL